MWGTRLSDLPGRIATGAYIFHAGWDKKSGGEEMANYLHGAASGAFPVFNLMKPQQFLKLLSTVELTVGALLFTPFVPTRLAAFGLTGFSGALVSYYLRSPSLRRPGSVWPNPNGLAPSKDVWMLGMGIGFLLGSRRGGED